jgi:cell division protein ZipA
MTVRDWMVVIGSLLIVAVIIDAWRRIRAEKRSRVRVKLVTDEPDAPEVDDISMLRELPNGGARVIKREDLLAARQHHDEEVAASRAAAQDRPQGDGGGQRADQRSSRAGNVQGSSRAVPDSDPLAGVRSERDEPANLDWLEDMPAEAEAADAGELPRGVETEVIILHVLADSDDGFDGKAILEILLACDLRFGDMSFFHRHEREAGRGPIQFSVANMLQPGVFDIDNMASMRTRGLVFFLTLPGPEDMLQAFDYMLETARTVARNLGGEVLDESRSVITEQSVEHARQQIRELDRRMLAHRR